MKNIYSIECDLFPKNKIIEILKHNNYYFFTNSPKPDECFGEYLSFNEDKMYFVKKMIVLNDDNFKIIIGNTYREDMNPSAFEIYFPNQIKTEGFNFNAEFSKILVTMKDFDLNASSPLLSINLHNKNIEKLINEKEIILSNVPTRASKKFKSLNLEETKRNGIEKLFLYKKEKFYLVIGWVLQGKKNKHTVIYNKLFSEFLLVIQPIDLKTPEGFALKRSNKKDSLTRGKTLRQIGDLGSNHNPKFITEDKKPVFNLEDNRKQWVDHTPNIDKINIILEKISRFGQKSLSIEEVLFLKTCSK